MPLACTGGSDSPATSSRPPTNQFTLSGTITPPDNASVDWDVNDANTTVSSLSNNELTSTQPISSPVSLAGHVSLAADIRDFYSLWLTGDQSIGLYIADTDKADIDLYLYDDRGQLLNSSMSDNAVESLDVDADGSYIIEVRIVSKGDGVPANTQASNYNLVVGKELNITAQPDRMRLSADFVPGDVIVRFADSTADAQEETPDGGIFKAQSLGLRHHSGEPGRPMLMQFDSQSESATVFKALGMSRQVMDQVAAMDDAEQQEKQRTLTVIKALRQRGDVLYAEPNYIRRIFATPNDTYFNFQWHYDQIRLPEAWDITTGSANVIVAVVDTGVLVRHPDLSGKLTGTGYDFIASTDISLDGDGIDSDPDDPGDQASPDNSSSFHGTHVSGTIAAATGNNAGVAGAGWATRVMAIRALGKDGAGTDYDIAQGIYYAAGLTSDADRVPPQRADIINLSLGGEENSKTLSDAVNAALGQGVIVVAAAGNDSTTTPMYPAAYDRVISVSAVDYAGNLAPYSNFGDTIDVAAPGGDSSKDLNGDGYGDGVLSTAGRDGSGSIEFVFGFYQGTSMAAPHMAAVAALMKAQKPDLTPDDLNALLASRSITTDIGSAENFGSGLIDAQKAVLSVQSGAVPTLLSVNPSLLSLGFALTGKTLTIEKIGDADGDLSVTSVTADAAWLSVAADAVDADGLGTYTVGVSRSGLTGGAYSGNITFVSTVNTVILPVSMQVSTVDESADAGYHYVLLINADTGETVYQTGVRALNGSYVFQLSGVAPGTYQLRAGTDLDDDGKIGDPGEAIGAFRSLDQPSEITVSSNLRELNFISEFNFQIGNATTTSMDGYVLLNRQPDKQFNER